MEVVERSAPAGPTWHRTWRAPVALAAAGLAGAALLGTRDPNDGGYLLCPLRAATGLDCPGCGGLRAVHALWHGDVALAADLNLLLVVSLPFVAVAWGLWLASTLGVTIRRPRWLHDGRAWSGAGVAVVLLVIVAFGIGRNIGGVAALEYLGSS